MTPEIHQQYTLLKALAQQMSPFLELWEVQRKEFEAEASKFSGGALDAILPHFMSISDMRQSQENLHKAIKVSRLMGELRKLLVILNGEAE